MELAPLRITELSAVDAARLAIVPVLAVLPPRTELIILVLTLRATELAALFTAFSAAFLVFEVEVFVVFCLSLAASFSVAAASAFAFFSASAASASCCLCASSSSFARVRIS